MKVNVVYPDIDWQLNDLVSLCFFCFYYLFFC